MFIETDNPLPLSGLSVDSDQGTRPGGAPQRREHRPDSRSRRGHQAAQARSESESERLARIRREIAAGTYLTPEKLAIVVERLMRCWEDSE